MRDTDQDWTSIAESNPYWGVLSADTFRGQEISEPARKEFFHSGHVLISNLAGFIKSHLDSKFAPRRSLDFGCGVGRLLIPIARLSVEAVGLDIAPRMRELTDLNITRSGITNAVCRPSDDNLSEAVGLFDFVNSYIVIQHIPPIRGMVILERLMSKVTIGGIVSVQLTFAKDQKFFSHERGKSKYYRREENYLIEVLPLLERDDKDNVQITMFDYDMNSVTALFSEYAGSPILMLPTNDDGHLGVHFVFRRAR